MSSPTRAVFALLAMTIGSVAAEASVRVVAPSGAPYTQISAAVGGASDGDVILVRSGNYHGFIVDNRALTIVADSGANVVIEEQVKIQNLATTRSVILAGLVIHPIANAPVSALILFNNAGSVRVEGCLVTGAYTTGFVPYPATAHGVEATANLDVAFVDCALDGGLSDWEGVFGLLSGGSSIALHQSAVHGGRAGEEGYGYSGGDGARLLSNNRIIASGCLFLGAAGSTVPDACPVGGNGVGAYGVSALFMQAVIAAPGRTRACIPTATPPQPYRLVGASLTLVDGRPRELHAATVTREQHTLEFQFVGEPGDQVELVVADGTRFAHRPDLHGVSLVRRRRVSTTFQVGMISGDGTLSWSLPVGDLGAGVESSVLHAQAYFTDASGSAYLSSPAVLVLLDSAF